MFGTRQVKTNLRYVRAPDRVSQNLTLSRNQRRSRPSSQLRIPRFLAISPFSFGFVDLQFIGLGPPPVIVWCPTRSVRRKVILDISPGVVRSKSGERVVPVQRGVEWMGTWSSYFTSGNDGGRDTLVHTTFLTGP